MSNMFKFITKTWNPTIGCEHNCSYCWARKLAEGRLKSFGGRYKDGFKPKLIESELNKTFKEGEFIFVCDMGDLFGEWVPVDWIIKVLKQINKSPDARFLLMTKNPKRYLEFAALIPTNCVLGCTIESNEHHPNISDAPHILERFWHMEELKREMPLHQRFISIEPIMDFDIHPEGVEIFFEWMKMIEPIKVAVGYDNYNNHLIEPSFKKTNRLIEKLREFTEVEIKTLREANE